MAIDMAMKRGRWRSRETESTKENNRGSRPTMKRAWCSAQ